jgi:hypothetical protein
MDIALDHNSKFEVKSTFSGSYRQNEVAQLLNVWEYSESAIFICAPGVGKDRFARFLAGNENLVSFSEFERSYFDCRNLDSDFVDSLDWIEKKVAKLEKEFVLILDSVDSLFDNSELLSRIFHINRHYSEKVHIVSFTSNYSFFQDEVNYPFLSKYDFLSHNMLYLPNMNEHDSKLTLDELLIIYNVEISDSGYRSLLDLGGGNNAFTISLVRSLASRVIEEADLLMPTDLVDKIPNLKYIVSEMLEELGDDIRVQLLSGTYYDTRVLVDLGVVSEKMELFTKLFEIILRQIHVRSSIYFPELFRASLTEQEELLLNLLVLKFENVVNRDEIAKVLWKEQYAQKYSDWAIEKVIQTLRDKIAEPGKGYEIKTKRGVGYFMIKL